jgi:hypothetical protein
MLLTAYCLLLTASPWCLAREPRAATPDSRFPIYFRFSHMMASVLPSESLKEPIHRS